MERSVLNPARTSHRSTIPASPSVQKYVRYPLDDGLRFGDPWRSKLEAK